MDDYSACHPNEVSAARFEAVGRVLPLARPSLIDPRFDHDSCGVGFVASVDAASSHTILEQALTALRRLSHRGAVAADGKSSDGVGIMTAVPREFLLASTGLSLSASQPL